MPFRSTPPVVSCDDCGDCCLVVTSPPFRRHLDGTGEEAWECLARERPDLRDELRADSTNRRANGLLDYGTPCLWYDARTRRCLHYDFRPFECRKFAVGSTDCLDARRRAGLAAARPNGQPLPSSNEHGGPSNG